MTTKFNGVGGSTAIAKERAWQWLQGFLANSFRPVAEIETYVEAHQQELGFSWWTVKRAKREHEVWHGPGPTGAMSWALQAPATTYDDIKDWDQPRLRRERNALETRIQADTKLLALINERLQDLDSNPNTQAQEQEPEPPSSSPEKILGLQAHKYWTDEWIDHHRLAFVEKKLVEVRDRLKQTDSRFASVSDASIHDLAVQPLYDCEDEVFTEWLKDPGTAADVVAEYSQIRAMVPFMGAIKSARMQSRLDQIDKVQVGVR
jgi:hypothetical protein